MSSNSTSPRDIPSRRDTEHWAKPVSKLKVSDVPAGAVNLNVEGRQVVAQVQSICRPADPIYDFAFRFLGSSGQQDKTWAHVLTSLAAHCGVQEQVQMHQVCVDPRIQWSQAKNIWKNSAARTMLYQLAAPLRWIGRWVQR